MMKLIFCSLILLASGHELTHDELHAKLHHPTTHAHSHEGGRS